jgi:NAD(P)-dependent dehydrogenase (short-subunit alcohol dehydrogenase family)
MKLKGQVALVTGGGAGIGEATAILLAENGAKVMVGDWNEDTARATADKIKKAGGAAEAIKIDTSKREDAERAVAETVKKLGRIDILINNAGITRDASALKMEPHQWDQVIAVNLSGFFYFAQAAAKRMREQNYGRIVVTTSSTGLYGNFGQTNYGAAKLSLVGFMNSLKLEGQKNNIHVNAISPVAATRMTENILPPQIADRLKPDYVTPGVVYLCSEEAPTGAILTAGAGAFAMARIYETEGVYLGEAGLSVEEVRDNWARICDPTGQQAYLNGGEQTQKFFRKMSETA